MKIIFFSWFLFLTFAGCINIEDNGPAQDGEYPFNETYFYYTFDWEKIQIFLNKTEIYARFRMDSISEEEAFIRLKKYFKSSDSVYISSHSNNNQGFHLKFINEDIGYLKERLRQINRDSLIDYSTPVFSVNPIPHVSPFGCDDTIILSDEICCQSDVPVNDLNSEFSKYGILISEFSEFNTLLLKVKRIESGFETLGISAYLYETGKFTYSHPNFWISICLW